MKLETIKDILKNNNIEYKEHATICGTIQASIGAYNNGLGTVMHTMKDHVLHFSNGGVAIIAVDDMNGTPKAETFMWISQKDVKQIRIKMKLFTFILTIDTDKGEIVYKIRRSVLGAPWHKENLSYLLLNLT